jgi:hypothetical protein
VLHAVCNRLLHPNDHADETSEELPISQPGNSGVGIALYKPEGMIDVKRLSPF